jgi:hypothetical protein
MSGETIPAPSWCFCKGEMICDPHKAIFAGQEMDTEDGGYPLPPRTPKDTPAVPPGYDDGWQPIETAPRDGTEFQAWVVQETDASTSWWEPRCRFDPDNEAFQIWCRVDYDQDGWDTDWNWKPTHWQPHPSPPTMIAAATGDHA